MARVFEVIAATHLVAAALAGSVSLFGGCTSPSASSSSTTSAPDAGDAGGIESTPLAGISADLVDQFERGERLFYAEMQPADGVGPLYTKTSCGDCHAIATRGPGAATKMVVVEANGVTPDPDQSLLPFGNTEHPLYVAEIPGVHTPILPPSDPKLSADAGDVSIRVTQRKGPPLFGRGFMEAIDDSEIERMASVQAVRPDDIHGRVNYITFVSQPNPDQTFDTHRTGDTVIGRFGLKARIATLDEFVADALQGDMGLTTPMRPTEFKNPDGITDDLKPGVDLTSQAMNDRATYLRLLAIPPAAVEQNNGKAWFEQCNCNVCHAETLHTTATYPIPELANIDAAVYSDMLLHDMGVNLADSVGGGNEGVAGPRDWRTAPLIALHENDSFLHDGRSSTLIDAIEQHASNGSEANASVACFNSQLSSGLQQQLIDFLNQL